MLKSSLLFLLFVFSTTFVHASETGIAKSNFKDWQGISLWCETDSPTVDQSVYICSMFYGEFSKQAKAKGIPFAYVQTEGTHTAGWLYANNWFPVSVEMVQVDPETTKAKVIVDFLENRDIRLYEKAIILDGSSFQYGQGLKNFFRNIAEQFTKDFTSEYKNNRS